MSQHDPLLRNLLPLKPVDFLLLAVLRDGANHGYALVQEMARRSDGSVAIRPGDLYRVLHRLETQNLVEAGEPAGPRERRRTIYRLTDLGERVLQAEAQRVARLAKEILGPPKKLEGTP